MYLTSGLVLFAGSKGEPAYLQRTSFHASVGTAVMSHYGTGFWLGAAKLWSFLFKSINDATRSSRAIDAPTWRWNEYGFMKTRRLLWVCHGLKTRSIKGGSKCESSDTTTKGGFTPSNAPQNLENQLYQRFPSLGPWIAQRSLVVFHDSQSNRVPISRPNTQSLPFFFTKKYRQLSPTCSLYQF